MNRTDKCSFLIILIANCYFVSAVSDSINRQVRQTRGSIRYQYNHPPEDFQPIPVAIFYEEKNDRAVKQLEINAPSTTTSTTTTLKSPKPISILTTTKPISSSTTTPKPISTSTTPKPISISTTTPKPISSSTTAKPILTSTTPKPISTSTTPRLISTSTASKPISTSSTPKRLSTSTTLIPEITTTTTPKIDVEDMKITTWRPLSTQRPNEGRAWKTKRIYPDKEIHIPVEVIYDEENDIIVRKQTNKVDISPNKKIGKQRRFQKEYKDISIDRIAKKISETTVIPTTIASQTTKKSNKDISIERKTTTEFTTVVPQNTKKTKTDFNISSTKPIGPMEVKNEESSSKIKKRREKDPVVPILESENHIYAQNGAFQYSYEGGDGTKAFQKGETIELEDEKTGETVSGGFSYTGKDGKDISLTYTADENGYRPVGDHLPTPPPIPVAIARALRYLATKPTEPPEEEATKPSKKE